MIFLNKNVRWSLSIFPLAAALLVACGGGGGGSSETPKSTGGQAVDGYIQYAKAILDENDNGVCSDTEASTVTSVTGAYSFPNKGEHMVCIVATADSVDISTGKPFVGTLLTAPGATVATPLTTLVMNNAKAAGWPATSYDISGAAAALMSKLGHSGVSLMSTNPVTASSDALLKKGMAVQALVDGIAGASTLTSAQASQKLAAYIATQSSVAINSGTFVAQFVSSVNNATPGLVDTDKTAAIAAAVSGSLDGEVITYLASGTQNSPTSINGSDNGGKNKYIASVSSDSAFVTISNCSANDKIALAGTTLADTNLLVGSTSTDVTIIRNGTNVVSIVLTNVIPSGVDASTINSIATFNALGKCVVSASN